MNSHNPSWIDADAATRQAALAEMLAQVSLQASQGETLDEVLKRIVDCIAARMPIAIASIILLNEPCTHFVQEVYAGSMDLDAPADGAWTVDVGAAGRCAQTGEPQLITDVQADPDYVPGNDSVRAEYLVPIRHRGRLLGVLNLESTEVDFFTPAVRAVFDAVAVQVAGSIHLARVVRELELANRRLERMSLSDGLTGIANRRCFDEILAEACRARSGRGSPLALLLVDVDHFKDLNDACGHVYGDECLRDLARLCAEMVRGDGDLVARYGGEEFVLLLRECDRAEAQRVAELLRRRVEALSIAHPASPVSQHLSVSIGMAVLPPDSRQPPELLIARADRALYAAKEQGRNRVVRDDSLA